MGFPSFLKSNKVYSPGDIDTVLEQITPYISMSYCNTKTRYINIPCAFDIETTSFFRSTGKGDEKCGIMYEWTLGLYGLVIVGRKWDEFLTVCDRLVSRLHLDQTRRLCVYVHNLSYEFQFIRTRFAWTKVFSIDKRKPIYATTDTGIEFRCSYLLSGYSLAKLGDELQEYHVRKLVGSLDYEKPRHAETPLTPEEIAYCVNDVKVVMAYIAERIKADSGIARIPLTKTGYVRSFCRDKCFYTEGESKSKSFKRLRYLDIMRGLRLSPQEYDQLKRAFQGGFTHANPWMADKVIEDVTSYDFTSSYPCVMVAEQFPMGSGEVVEIRSKEQFLRNLRLYCCLFDIEFTGLESVVHCDSYISRSRCWDVENAQINNGRIVRADCLRTTLTEQDYMIIRKMYKWKGNPKIGTFRRYKRDYLPKDFVLAILKLYGDKTTLKGVEGMEVEYLRSKEMLNSCFGMTVTDIVRDEHPYTDHWLESKEIPPKDKQKEIAKYNNNRGRFLFYPWGVWVTAYARRNLFSGILEFGTDYIYSDTDSIKVRRVEKHREYLETYNRKIREQLYRAMDYHELPHDLIEPMTKDGVKKCLGVWDFDGHYSRFKTLGAKRYLVQYSDDAQNKSKDRGRVQMTVAGLNKQTAVPYLCRGWAYTLDRIEINSPFDRFTEDLYIPPAYTGKMIHTYIDSRRTGVLNDYTGRPGEYDELSGIHLDKADYTLSISQEYSDFLAGLWDED